MKRQRVKIIALANDDVYKNDLKEHLPLTGTLTNCFCEGPCDCVAFKADDIEKLRKIPNFKFGLRESPTGTQVAFRKEGLVYEVLTGDTNG